MTDPIQFTSVTPYLRYPDADVAVEWLTRVFGFGPSRAYRGESGEWLEGEIRVGPVTIDVNGTADLDEVGGRGFLLIIGVTDVDALYQHILDAGEKLDPPRDEDYGPRTCHLTDPWGYQWYFWQGTAVY